MRRSGFLFFTTLFLWTISDAFAQTPRPKAIDPVGVASPDGGNNTAPTYAIVVGVSKYRVHKPDLTFAHKDGQDFEHYLRSEAGGSVPYSNVKLLTDSTATLARIRKEMKDLEARLVEQKNAKVVLFFSMHGGVGISANCRGGYLIAHDTDTRRLCSTGFPLEELKQFCTRLANRYQSGVQVYIDACNSGMIQHGYARLPRLYLEMEAEWLGVTKVVSSQADELSYEGDKWKNGVFTYYLLRGLKGLADNNNFSAKRNGQVDLYEIKDYLRKNVLKDIKLGTSTDKQIPQGSGKEETVLAIVHEPTLKALRPEQEMLVDIRGVRDKGPVAQRIESADNEELRRQFRLIQTYEASVRGSSKGTGWPGKDNIKSVYLEDHKRLEATYERTETTDYYNRAALGMLLSDANSSLALLLNGGTDRLGLDSAEIRQILEHLREAARLLGPDDHRYSRLQAHQYYFQGLYFRSLKDSRSALKQIKKAIRQDTSALYAFYELAAILNEENKNEEALRALEKPLREAPEWTSAIHLNGKVLRGLMRYEEAAEAFDKAFETDNRYYTAMFDKGSMLMDQARFLEAVEVYDRILAIDKSVLKENLWVLKTRWALESKGSAMYRLGSYEEALSLYDSSIVMEKRSPEKIDLSYYTYWNRGLLLEKLQMDREAMSAYRKAESLRPGFAERNVQNLDSLTRLLIKNSADLLGNRNDPTLYFSRGKLFYEWGRFDRAIEALRKAIALKPDFSDAHLGLALAYREAEKYPEAIQTLMVLTKVNPQDKAGARLLIQLKEHLSSVSDYENLVNRGPNAYLAMGLSFLGIENYDRAVESFNQAIDLNRDFYRAYFYKGQALGRIGYSIMAQEVFEKAVQLNDTLYDAYLEIAQIHANSDEKQQALKTYDRAIKANAARFEAYSEKGKMLLGMSRHGEAYTCLSNAIARNAGYSGLHYRQGLALFNLKRYRDAIKSFDRALVLDPDYYRAMTYKGIALEKLKKSEEAITTYDRAIALSGQETLALHRKGRLLIENGQHEKGIEVANQAIALDSSLYDSFVVKWWGLIGLSRYEAALEMLHIALPLMKKDPDNAYVFKNRTADDVIEELVRVTRRIEAADQLLSTSPMNVQGYLDKATIFSELNYFEAALPLVERAIQLKPDLFRAHLLKYVILQATDRFSDLVNVFKELSNIPPANADEKKVFGELFEDKEQGVGELETLARLGDAQDFNSDTLYFERGRQWAGLNGPVLFNEKALLLFENAIALGPDRADVFFEKGLLLKKMGREQNAIEDFGKAISLKPDFFDAYKERGMTLGGMGHFSEAAEDFDACIFWKEDDYSAHFWKGRAMGALDYFGEESVSAFNKAILLKNESPDPYYYKGISLFGLERYDEALAAFDRAEELNVNYPKLHLRKGRTLRRLKRPEEEALKAFEKAVQSVPEDEEALFEKGLSLVSIGDYDQALSLLEKIQPRGTDKPDITLFALLAMEVGDYRKAIQHLETYIDQDFSRIAEGFVLLAFSHLSAGDDSTALYYFKSAMRSYDSGRKSDRLYGYPGLKRSFEQLGEKHWGNPNQLVPTTAISSFLSHDPMTVAYLGMACVFSRRKEEKAALENLETALWRGYNNWNLLESGPALDGIRRFPKFKRLINTYNKKRAVR